MQPKSTTTEFKECPFCHSSNLVQVKDHCGVSTVYYITCKGSGNLNGYCNAQGPRTFESIEQAIAAWNQRHQPQPSESAQSERAKK